jgi:hypothetical protein
VGFAGGAAQFAVLRAWLTEQLDQRFTFFILRLVLRDAQHFAERPSAPGRPCASACTIVSRQRSTGGATRHCMAQHRAVKVRIVEIKQGIGVGDCLAQSAGDWFASGQIPDANRLVAMAQAKSITSTPSA